MLLTGMGFDASKPYGADMEDKVDLSEPMKRFIATNLKGRCGLPANPATYFTTSAATAWPGLRRKSPALC